MATNNFAFQTFAEQITQGVNNAPKEQVIKNLARVIHVVYGPTIPGTNIADQYYKGPMSLGTITFQLFGAAQDRTAQSAGNPPATPLFGSMKKLPVKGEIVQIVVGVGDMNDDKENPAYYYTQPIALWKSAHHNAFPDMGDYGEYVNNEIQTYQQSQLSRTPDNPDPKAPVNFPLGPGFPEKPNIKTLRQFPGDVILEGRWGNSVRLGSTTAILQDQNTWSNDSVPGNPITIIRNGQGRQLEEEGFIPTVENINRDPSSIYLTNGQKIIIDDIQNNFSLASLGVNLQTSITLSIPVQQSLQSFETISPFEQDQRVAEVTNTQGTPERTDSLS
jgi:hypothetical protein